MFVVKRDGTKQPVHFDKITRRVENLREGLHASIDSVLVAQKVVAALYSGITTSQLDELAAETAVYLSTTHPDYSVLAARIAVSNLHKNTEASFAAVCAAMAAYVHAETKLPAPLLADDVNAFIQANAGVLDAVVNHDYDLAFDYFGFKTLERTYLGRVNGKVVERPQHMFMRVAVAVHYPDIAAIEEAYVLMATRQCIHATPTLFNAGAPRPQMSSCFLLTMKEDSIEGIFGTLKDCAVISKYAGGIGLAVHDVRASNSYIRGTNGTSNGLVPMLKVFSDTARYVDQGGGKRKGSIAIYLEPWHADVVDFLHLKKNHGFEEARARDLFYALWVPDLFMKRVQANGAWSLFCPNEAPGLSDCWGDDFEKLYHRYEDEGRARETISAQTLWFTILESQMETGTPYLVYKDACNRASNQQHLGTLRCSNLCTEIVQYTAPDEVAVCNLASVALPAFVAGEVFNHEALGRVVRFMTRALNNVIDRNFYPIPEAATSNLRHRPIGLGVQGLADTLIRLRLPYESAAAAQVNREIFETMYYYALTESCALAETHGPHASFAGSPASRGVLHFDHYPRTVLSGRYDWEALRSRVMRTGLRNSLLIAPMPTASTAQILGNTEAFEPITSNLYTRRVLAGDFMVVNKYMTEDLMALGLWNKDMVNAIIAHKGSVQGIASIPRHLKDLYKTAWEMKMKVLIDMAADRGAFVDQSQSLNLFVAEPSEAKLTSMHFYGWAAGLKTGMYYLRTKPRAAALQFTVDAATAAATAAAETPCDMCSA